MKFERIDGAIEPVELLMKLLVNFVWVEGVLK